ncbi:hypothetical protein [Streptomyces sp. MZ04]|uniref:hypothetical protein n=1 Tax=Streptomyces sp. MZ04 TaxID=2559236 RepID=UPI001FD7E8B0|nr:hypothetical protein [Streptomyces sp. MZ04]
MIDNREGTRPGHGRRSRLADLADMTVPAAAVPAAAVPAAAVPAAAVPAAAVPAAAVPDARDESSRIRREFAALLGEFRRTAVLLPLGEDACPLTADFNGIRWIYAFSDEAALARFAVMRGDGARAWDYQCLLGARLLDGVVPAVGVPCGVALDVGSEGDEVLLPPLLGIVPDAVAVDADEHGEDGQ